MADPSSAAAPSSGAPSTVAATDSITPTYAGFLGTGLVALGLLAFVGTVAVTSSSQPTSLAFAAMSGVALLSLTLIGIIVLSRAIGMTDATQALGLPQGSVRALLAFALAIVFVSVASWTLGGLFDPMGPQVAKRDGAAADVDAFLKRYQDDPRYIIVEKQADEKTASATVFLKREAPDKDVVDIAKQIVTISATVLVTIVGFYFGSKSTSDVTKAVNDSLAAVRKGISDTKDALNADPPGDASPQAQAGAAPNPPNGSPASVIAPATADDVVRAASTAAALVTATTAKLQSLGAAPLDILRQAVAEGTGGDAVKEALSNAETSFAALSDTAKACAEAGAKADELAHGAGTADPAALALTNGKLQDLLNGAMQANHAFEQAYAVFAGARQRILAATAK